MSTPTEALVEDVCIALLRMRAALAEPVQIRNFDDPGSPNATRIVVKAERGELRQDGPGGHDYTVIISIYAPKGGLADFETMRREIEDAMSDAPAVPSAALTDALAPFYYFGEPPTEGHSAERTIENKSRGAEMRFTIRAKLA